MTTDSIPAEERATPPWRDTSLSVADRVELLLHEMTLEEKVAQLGSRNAGGQPSTYLQPPLGGGESSGISTLDSTPLFPFGYGTSFEVDGRPVLRTRTETVNSPSVETSVSLTRTPVELGPASAAAGAS